MVGCLAFAHGVGCRGRWASIMQPSVEAGPGRPSFEAPHPMEVRKALMTAIDREQMVDSLMGGLGGVGHSLVLPDEPEYRGLDQRAVRYEYDPRQAIQMVEALGYARGADGFFVDPAQQRVTLEVRTVATDIAQKATLAVADSWQRAGLGVDQFVVPAARQNDLPYRSTYPGFELF